MRELFLIFACLTVGAVNGWVLRGIYAQRPQTNQFIEITPSQPFDLDKITPQMGTQDD